MANLGGAAPNSGLGAVLSEFGVRDARQVFSSGQIQADEARTAALRAAAASGAASPEQAGTLERLPPLASFVRLRFPPGTPSSEVTAALGRLPEVTRAVPVPKAAPPTLAAAAPLPSDPLIGPFPEPVSPDPNTGLEWQWYLHRTRVPQAWRFARGTDVVLADIDWGFRTSHRDLRSAVRRTYNAVDGGSDVTQGANAAHGTAVLGIAGARGDNAGMAGIAPEAELWAIQGDSGPGQRVFEEPWAEALDFVRRSDSGGRRKVVILEVQTASGGNYEQVPSVHRAIRAAIADGCIVCVAAGNGNRPADRTDIDTAFDPTGSILVGATSYEQKFNKRAWFSNFGSRIVVSAPGDTNHDLTCGQTNDTAYRNGFGGTSGATPKVAGAAALMLSVNPELSHDDVREILSGTGDPLQQDPGKPIGVFLNVEAAVAEARRRHGESRPSEVVAMPAGQPSSARSRPLHGVRRRSSQLTLPEDAENPISFRMTVQAEVVGANAAAARADAPPVGDRLLSLFRESVEGTLTQQDRILIVAQAIQMLDNFYVHRPLKEAMHAVRPIQRLRVLLRRLQQGAEIPAAEQDELTFHNTLTQIFNSVRDLHTNYLLPRPYRDYIAYLPFEVAPFYEEGKRRYLVTRVVPGYSFADPAFGAGVELVYWNGMTIERAVRANAEQTAGSNEAARHARGVNSLTLRPMNTALPPDADFVDLEFVPRGADTSDPAAHRPMRQHWFVRYAPSQSSGAEGSAAVPAAPTPSAADIATPTVAAAPFGPSVAAHTSIDFGRESTARSSNILFAQPAAPATPPRPMATSPSPSAPTRDIALAAALGLDVAADTVREARQLIFDADALQNLMFAAEGDEAVGIRGSASPAAVEDAAAGTEINVRVPWNAAFRARIIDVDGISFGHIQIHTFYVDDADGFVREFIRLVEQIPEEGLILDVRGNGGGNIWAAERLLQTLTPVEIKPERMQFVVTPGTLDLCRNNPTGSQIPLGAWRPSLEEAVETGSTYSHAFPLTDPESCNAIGQRYYGPVVLIVDGNCYSATDIFAAGFQDHDIGKVLGVSTNTGAGGANVWDHWLLTRALPVGWGLKPLPNEAGMRVAIRQCLRVGARAGALLEDFGVEPDEVHQLTRDDVLYGDRQLVAKAAEILGGQPRRSLKVTMGGPVPANPSQRSVEIRVHNLKRLDFYVNDRPEGSVNITLDAKREATLSPFIENGAQLRIVGYAEGSDRSPSALYRGTVP